MAEAEEDQDEEENCCGDKCASVSAFIVVLVSALLFISMFGVIHSLFLHTVHKVFRIEGQFSGVYIILIVDVFCSAFGILICLENITNCVLIVIFIVFGLSCAVNAFVGIFITTGIAKVYHLSLTSDVSDEDAKKSFTCAEHADYDKDCHELGIVQICFYVMYLHLLVKVVALFFARRAFFIETVNGRRRSSAGVPMFIQRRLSKYPDPSD